MSEHAPTDAMAIVERFLKNWKPFAELGGTALPGQVLALLEEPDPEARRRHLLAASDLYRLHERYRELELFREGRNEKAEQFERLLRVSAAEMAAAIERGAQKEHLALLQFCFEFGRHPQAPRHSLMRAFILRMLALPPGGLGFKYSLYPEGVLYTSAGKTHDEMAQDTVRLGMAGKPIAGGTFSRTGEREFVFDMASTAFKATNDPAAVSEPLLRWIRNTGGREDRITLRHDDTRERA